MQRDLSTVSVTIGADVLHALVNMAKVSPVCWQRGNGLMLLIAQQALEDVEEEEEDDARGFSA